MKQEVMNNSLDKEVTLYSFGRPTNSIAYVDMQEFVIAAYSEREARVIIKKLDRYDSSIVLKSKKKLSDIKAQDIILQFL